MNNVKDFGAKGDGIVKDTVAVQSAIDAGGPVYFPSGIYLCGSLYLRTGTSLIMEDNAVIKGSPDRNDYNLPDFCPQNNQCPEEKSYGAHLINAVEVEHIRISGGKIDGNRPAFFDPSLCKRNQFTGWRPSQLLYFCECTNLRITDCSIVDAPYWACFVHGCQSVMIRGVNIRNQFGVWNGDGIDIDSSRQVCISDCNLDTSDDSLTIRASGRGRLQHTEAICEDVVVSNCILKSQQAAIRLGVGNGLIRHCTFSNLCIRQAAFGICMLSTYLPQEFPEESEGVAIDDIIFSNIVMTAGSPIDISSNWMDYPLPRSGKRIENIIIQNVLAHGYHTSIIQGNDDMNVRNITISDMTMELSEGYDITENVRRCKSEVYHRSCGMLVTNAADIHFNRCSIKWRDEDEKWRFALEIDSRSDIHFCDCSFLPPRNGEICNRKEFI